MAGYWIEQGLRRPLLRPLHPAVDAISEDAACICQPGPRSPVLGGLGRFRQRSSPGTAGSQSWCLKKPTPSPRVVHDVGGAQQVADVGDGGTD